MAMDYNSLIEPIGNTKFATLRKAQEFALRHYASSAHSLHDLAIELPTGSGKTLIALLILEIWRKQGKRVAILTGNKTLARQVEDEAKLLRVPVVRFEGRGEDLTARDLRAYRRGNAIAVMNYWVYINQNPAVEEADYIVIDDCQLTDGALSSLFTLSINLWDHPQLFSSAMQLISQYSDSPIADDIVKKITDASGRPADLICFSDFLAMREEFEALVDGYFATPAGQQEKFADLGFRWNRVRDRLGRCLCLISPDEIAVRPLCYPSQDLAHMAKPIQRIYMSATLHDPNDLQRRLGTGQITKFQIPAGAVQEEDGRRLFIFNQVTGVSNRMQVSEEVLTPLRELLSIAGKSVWMCSSRREAQKWEEWLKQQLSEQGESGTRIWRLSPIGDELDQFRAATRGHLVIAGRFEGMDFPDDVCRLAVFPSVPRATGLLERFITEQLRDAVFQKLRMLERIKQGVGRCTRGKGDFAIYYFLEPRFYTEMESSAFASLVSERTRRQIELGLRLTETGMSQVLPLAKKFLKAQFRDFDERERRAEPPPIRAHERSLPASMTVQDEVDGWRALFEKSDYERAANCFENVCRLLSDGEREHRAFWRYLQSQAEFLAGRLAETPGSFERALQLLRSAIKEGASSSWFTRLSRAANRLAGTKDVEAEDDKTAIFDQWDQLVEQYPYQKGRFLKWQAALKAQLDGGHDQVCEALEVLGGLLGFASSRPRGQAQPDVFWREKDRIVTIEAKIDLRRDSISRDDVNQADGHRRAAVKELGLPDTNVNALIVSRATNLDKEAVAALGRIRALPLDLIEELRLKLEIIMRDYWRTWVREDATARLKARQVAMRRLPRTGWLSRAIRSANAPILGEEELSKEWPKN